MKIKKTIYNQKYECKLYLTFDEMCSLRDYIDNKNNSSATGQIKNKLEKLIGELTDNGDELI